MDGDLRFRILGPLEARTAGAPVPVGPLKQRVALALLLYHANSIVPVDVFIDALWPDSPPRTAQKNLQIYMSTLRKLLWSGEQDQPLRHEPPGYRLYLGGDLDALRFTELARAARLAIRAGNPAMSSRIAAEALQLWRGPALADLQSVPSLLAASGRLESDRAAVWEDWLEAELALGNHCLIMDVIDDLVRQHPLRERLRSSQMVALYRSGRQADAVAEFDAVRRRLAAELGLQPSPALARLFQAILAGDPALDIPQPPRAQTTLTRPGVVAHLAQLPRGADDFTGRDTVIGELVGCLAGKPRPVRLAVIAGPPGVGKTALGVHVAHRLGAHYPDGQLFIRLRSPAGRPRPPTDVLAEVLASLVPGTPIPPRVDERTALYQSALAERRLLLVLDGASDEAHVLPLLPGPGDSGALVVGRRRLRDLGAAVHVELEPFSVTEALQLLGRIIGACRLAAEPVAAKRIAAACDLLPLGIRIAGAKIAAAERMPLERFAGRLADDKRLLDVLTVGDLSLRACAAAYLDDMPAEEQAAARRLGLLPGSEFSAADFAALTGTTVPVADGLLDRLVEAHYVMVCAPPDGAAPAVYRLPRWLRACAAERVLAEESECERTAAMRRLMSIRSSVAASHCAQCGRPAPAPGLRSPAQSG